MCKTTVAFRSFVLAVALVLLSVGSFGQEQSEQQESEKVYKVGGEVRNPVLVRRTLPLYTSEALRKKIEGKVLIQAVVRKDGSIDSFKILKKLGYGLDERAVKEISEKWEFRPGTLEGKPVNVRVSIEVAFMIKKNGR